MKKQIIEIKTETPNIFKIENKFFVLKEQKIEKGHIKKLIFEEVNKKEYREDIEELIKETLKSNEVSREEVLRQAFLILSKKDLEAVRIGLKRLKKPKLKRGCLSLNIDGIDIPIFSRASCLE